MAPKLPSLRYEFASAVSVGRRDCQEDSIVTDFPIGADVGFVVLSDGMGGHASGDVASKIVATEVFSDLKIQSGEREEFEQNIHEILCDAAHAANACIRSHSQSDPSTQGMGATLVAPVFIGSELYWISVGDSPFYLFRDGKLRQLNEDHSMAPQIDYLVRTGMISAASGAAHPDLNCLTSVLIGREIARIDCPDEPFQLHDQDLLIVASDGLQFLEEEDIQDLLCRSAGKGCSEIADLLMGALDKLDDPDQDNVTLSVIRFHENYLSEPVRFGHRPVSVLRQVQPSKPPVQASAPARQASEEPAPIQRTSKILLPRTRVQ